MKKSFKKAETSRPGSLNFSFESVTSVMNGIGTAWVFVLLILINTDIAGRAFFNSPIRGVPEIVSLSIVGCVFLQLAHTLRVGRLTRSEMFLNWLNKKTPKISAFLDGIYHLVGACLMVIILKASYPMFTKAWRIDEYVGAQGDFMAPVWPVKLIILAGCLVSALQFTLIAWQRFRQMGNLGGGKA